MLKKTIQITLFTASFLLLIGVHSCINDPKNEEVTGIFNIQITGDIQDTLEGVANFELIPKTDYGLVIVRLEEDELNYVMISFVNSSPTNIRLEPGDYNIVSQIVPNNQKEVLVDYYINGVKNSGNSGSVSIGISKETQLKGRINTANFTVINSFMSGNYDAKRK